MACFKALAFEQKPKRIPHWVVIVNGPGIAPEIADRLFQPFLTIKSQGIGVGLSICRSILEAHNGGFWVEPNPEGGTVFHFTVPAVQ